MAAHRRTFLANKMTRRKVVRSELRIAEVLEKMIETEAGQEMLGLKEKPWYRRIF